MITFTLCLLALVAGYFIYGRVVERIFGPDDRKTPALTRTDGVDYIPMPTWKIFMIQFLNIAGLGPIFGAIMGAKFGTASYLWIVLGSIFAGAVHPPYLFLPKISFQAHVSVHSVLFGVYKALHQQSRRRFGDPSRRLAHSSVQPLHKGRVRSRAGELSQSEMGHLVRKI